MTDRKALAEQNETPEDVASLYSWANLHGAKYRDFSASRAQTREKARLRVQQALDEERERTRQQADAEHSEQLRLATSSVQNEEQARRERAAQEQAAQEQASRQQAVRYAAQQAAEQAAQQAAQLAAQQMVQQAAQLAAERQMQLAAEQRAQQSQAAEQARFAEQARAAQFAAEQVQAARQAAGQAQAARQAADQAWAAQRAAEETRELQQAAEQARAAHQAAEQAQAAQRAAQEARAVQQAAEQARAVQMASEQAEVAQRAAQEAQAAQQAVQQIRAAQQAAWQQQRQDPPPAPPVQMPTPAQVIQPPAATPAGSYFAPQSFAAASSANAYRAAAPFQAAVPQPVYSQAPAREERRTGMRSGWGGEYQDPTPRPAWLSTGVPAESSAPAPVAPVPAMPPLAPEDTLQGQRDRMTSRWFALKGVFHGGVQAVEPAPVQSASRAPLMAVFSLAGGVGKTSLTATLGRALSARGERVLLVDTAPFGLLPFYFGARDQRPGQLRTFTAPGAGGDAPVQMVTIDTEVLGPETAQQEPLSAEIGKYSMGVSRVIVDLATASGATTRRVLRLSPLVLVPVMPDMNSVVSVSAIDAFFQRTAGSNGPNAMPFYVLNQFDASLPLHLDVREVLREQLGERLLPFALRRAPAVSEALAEGMTVVDYAPSSTVAEDFGNLAGWVKSQSAPASSGFRGVRWSER